MTARSSSSCTRRSSERQVALLSKHARTRKLVKKLDKLNIEDLGDEIVLMNDDKLLSGHNLICVPEVYIFSKLENAAKTIAFDQNY